MKTAVSSVSFARAIAAGELTQLEWLDLCANEVEADGVVFAAEQFPRDDDEYLAQLKKFAVDLGLTVAAVAANAFAEDGERWLTVAQRLGAPLVIATPHVATDDPAGWSRFTQTVGARSRRAKAENVTLAVRNARGTLCTGSADLRRLAKDVDSAWLRYALDSAPPATADDAHEVLAKTVIVVHVVERLATFATPGDESAPALIDAVARFRGFVVLESRDGDTAPGAYHAALERFTALRTRTLVAGFE